MEIPDAGLCSSMWCKTLRCLGGQVASTLARRVDGGARLTLEPVLALVAASERTTLLLELGHGDGRKGGGGMVLSSVVVNLVNGDGCVGDVRLDGLLLDDGLDSLVDVVVVVLASDDRVDLTSGLAVNASGGVYVTSPLGGKALLDIVVVVVLVATVLNGDDIVVVLLGEDLTVGHGLLGGVVVILVNLLVNGRGVLLVLLLLDGLVLDGRGNLLVDGGVVVTSLAHKVLDGSLGRVHFD
jgi:hypothetical protein